MDEIDREFYHPVRSFLIRYAEYNREKGATATQLEELDQTCARLLAGRELKEAVVNRLSAFQLRSDYHNLIMLTLLQQLAKWSQQYYNQLIHHPGPLQCILTQSITIISGQQQYHTIVPKQNQLMAVLLAHPHTIQNLQQFKVLYRRLKDVKEFYPSATRDHQKQCFLRAIEECLQRAAQAQNMKIVEFVFGNIFNELETLQETHEYVSQRLKIVRKVSKLMWVYHQDILHKVAFLLMRLSHQVLTNKHLFAYILPIYENLLTRLTQRPSLVPLLLFKHLVLNNLTKLLGGAGIGGLVLLEALLGQVAALFKGETLLYFMRHYDWNYLELPVCQQALHLLYEFTENRAYENRPQYQLTKTYLSRIHAQLRIELTHLHPGGDDDKWKFYQLKRKEFQQQLEEMNLKPKKLLKRIETLSGEIKEAAVAKVVRAAKKAAQLEGRAMIDIFASDHPVSAQLFAQYVDVVLKQCREHDLQEFMRLFTSNFLLTGESQQIGRVMDTITQLYFRHQDPEARILKSSDATYTFANAILILNTDLHNPKNQEKISEQSFLKMCRKINDNEDLPVQVLKKTYANIKRNKINTFRDRGSMLGISLSNWLTLCSDQDSLSLAYYDPEMALLDDKTFHRFVADVLTGLMDEKETAKLQALVQRFVYDDKVFECQVIQTLRRISQKKPHLPLHILQKVLELANFRNSRPNDKLLSYYWLASTLIATFPALLPPAPICELLLASWDLRSELQDHLHLRQMAQVRRVKQSMRSVAKREAKKSIMDMFSNFLSFKESDEDPDPPPSDLAKKANFKTLSNAVFDVLKYSEGHRVPAIDFLVGHIHNQEAKQYEQFLGCLFLIFNLLHHTDSSELLAEDLFYELLGLKESSITKRLSNLAKKDSKLYNTLSNYSKFWILKLLLKEYVPSKLAPRQNNNYEYLLGKALEYLERVDKQILTDLIKELTPKTSIPPVIFLPFENSIKKLFPNGSQEAQLFLDKFSKQEQSPTNTQQGKIGEISADQIDKSIPNQEKNDEVPKEKSAQENEAINCLQEKEEGHIVKQRSIDQLEQYLNPDEEINKVEEEIESHLNINHHQQLPQHSYPSSPVPVDTVKKEKEEEREQLIESKAQETPSIPVVMF